MENNTKANQVNDIIYHIVNVSEITNKWLMWCESNTPDKAVFVPTIFQMRDAYSHIIKMLGKGFDNGFLSNSNSDFNSLFSDSYSIKQLEEAFAHSARAFYDCADYILLVIKQEVVDAQRSNKLNYVDLRAKLLKNDFYITELRSAKSEDMIGNYENIKKWDLFLQLITSSYTFGDFDMELLSRVAQIKTKLNLIERKFSTEVIKNHEPQFYEKKKILLELETLPQQLELYFKDDSVVSAQLLESSQEWSEEIVSELQTKIKKADEYDAMLDGLQKIMFNSNGIEKAKSVFNTLWGGVTFILSWFTSNFLSSKFLIQQVYDAQGNTQTITVDKLDWKFLFPFIVLFCLIFGLGKVIFNKILKKWIK